MNSGVAELLGLLGKDSGQASVLIVVILVLQWVFQNRLSPRACATFAAGGSAIVTSDFVEQLYQYL